MTPGVSVIVLAAGEGSRMGIPKALATNGDQTFLQQIATPLIPDYHVTCAIGAKARDVRERHRDLDVTWTLNPAWSSTDMFHTLLLALDGLAARGREQDVVLVWPVDVPFDGRHVVETLLQELAESGALAAVPVLDGSPGHPVALSSTATRAMRGGRWPHLRAWLQAHDVVDVPVDEPGILRNINRARDLRDLT